MCCSCVWWGIVERHGGSRLAEAHIDAVVYGELQILMHCVQIRLKTRLLFIAFALPHSALESVLYALLVHNRILLLCCLGN